jgi:ribose transport system substrate-binding protein
VVAVMAWVASGAAALSVSTAAGASGTASSRGVAAAEKYLKQYLKPPTSIGITTPLTKKPPTHELIVGLDSGAPVALELAKYWAQAASDLGWTYKDINCGYTAASEQAALETAIQLKPAGIVMNAVSASSIQTQLALAKQAGIWVSDINTTDPPQGALFNTAISGPGDFAHYAKLLAAEAVVSTSGNAHVQIFTLPFYQILTDYDNDFKASIAKWCSACTVKVNPEQATDIGTAIPGAVVSAIQTAPATNWVVFDSDAEATGVVSALAAAGLKVNIGGAAADSTDVQGVKDKTEFAWTEYPTAIIAYRQIDTIARKLVGDPVPTAPLATMLITQSNVGTLHIDSSGNDVGVANYRAQFDKLWLKS